MISLVFWRCLFGAIALFIVCAALSVFRGNLTRRVITYAALGGVAIVANWLLLFAAFPLASISIATAVYSTQPFILVGLGALFLGEKVTATKLLWLALSFGGALLIIQARPSADYAVEGYLIGIAMASRLGLGERTHRACKGRYSSVLAGALRVVKLCLPKGGLHIHDKKFRLREN